MEKKKLIFEKKSLIGLCGPSGSGKSFFAQQFFRPTQIVSSDKCREIICDDEANQSVSADAFDLFYTIIGYRLKYGRLTVADATNLSPQYRRKLIELGGRYNTPVYLVVFDVDLQTCLKNNTLRERIVPESVIISQLEKLNRAKELQKQEGFKEIYYIRPNDVPDKIEIVYL